MKIHLLLATVASGIFFSASAFADMRPFAFLQDAYPLGKGNFEYEQFNTWAWQTGEDNGFNQLNFKHEFEFGLSDNFDLGLYLPTWSYTDDSEGSRTRFESVAVEGIVYLSDPDTDWLGSALYAEVGIGEDQLFFEGKLILQKDIGQWTFGYNLVVETEIEGVFDSEEDNEVEGVIEHAFGANYQVNDRFSLGGEALVESIWEDWSEYDATTAWVGPSLGYVWETPRVELIAKLTPLVQVTDVDDEPRFLTRLLIELEF